MQYSTNVFLRKSSHLLVNSTHHFIKFRVLKSTLNYPTRVESEVQIVSAEDEKIKLIGNMLFTDTSRKILRLLLQEELSAGQIAQKSEMLISLAMYHLEKLQQAGLVKITKTAKSSKGHEVKYYGPSKMVVVIFPKDSSSIAKRGIFGFLNKKCRLAIIGLAGIVSAMISQNVPLEPTHGDALYAAQASPLPLLIPVLILCSGLLIDIIGSRIRR